MEEERIILHAAATDAPYEAGRLAKHLVQMHLTVRVGNTKLPARLAPKHLEGISAITMTAQSVSEAERLINALKRGNAEHPPVFVLLAGGEATAKISSMQNVRVIRLSDVEKQGSSGLAALANAVSKHFRDTARA